jgi:serine protease AprX
VKFIFTSKIASGIFLAASLLAQNSKLAPDLAILDPNEPVDVIIQLNDPPPGRPGAPAPPGLSPSAASTSPPNGPVRELGLINGLAARLPAASLASLAADPRVKYISPDRPVTATLTSAIPAIGADIARSQGFDGRGIGVAIIDSGVNDHALLRDDTCARSRIVFRENFAPPDAAYTVFGFNVEVRARHRPP